MLVPVSVGVSWSVKVGVSDSENAVVSASADVRVS